MKYKREKMIHVHCPICSNKRLFDLSECSEGGLTVQCPRCKQEVVIDFRNVIEKRQRKRKKRYLKAMEELKS